MGMLLEQGLGSTLPCFIVEMIGFLACFGVMVASNNFDII